MGNAGANAGDIEVGKTKGTVAACRGLSAARQRERRTAPEQMPRRGASQRRDHAADCLLFRRDRIDPEARPPCKHAAHFGLEPSQYDKFLCSRNVI